MPNNQPLDLAAFLPEFIEQWLRIDAKDPDWLKQSKMTARKEFTEAITAYTEQAVRAARIEITDTIFQAVNGKIDKQVENWAKQAIQQLATEAEGEDK